MYNQGLMDLTTMEIMWKVEKKEKGNMSGLMEATMSGIGIAIK